MSHDLDLFYQALFPILLTVCCLFWKSFYSILLFIFNFLY